MEFDLGTLGIIISMMVLANRLVEMLIVPIFNRYHWDRFWLMFPAWVLSGVLVWLTGVNLFVPYIASEIAGKILTAIVAGGGANLLDDLSDQRSLVAIVDLPKKEEAEGVGEK